MANSPVPWLERPVVPDSGLPFIGGESSAKVFSPSAPPDAEAILSTLQQRIAAGTHDLDLILGEIAEAAHRLTGSTGAAIATRKGGDVICQGRSGDTAPPLGARLSVDSGFSGECLRTGMALRCDDASKDQRADQEVCRQLGLRSIAAIPLRQRGKAVGILEAFSTRPYAFAEEHMDLLARLAQTAEAAAFSPGSEVAAAALEASREVEAAPESLVPTDLGSSETLVQLRDKIAPLPEHAAQDDDEHEHRQRYRLGSVALTIILLISAAGWEMWRKSAGAIASRTQPSASANTAKPEIAQPIIQVEGLGAAFGAGTTRKPSPSVARSQSRSVPPLRVVQRTPTLKDTPLNLEGHAFTLSPRSPANAAELMNVISLPAVLPKLSAPASQGVTGGVPVRKVQPIYPSQALKLGIEGSVLLQATVTEDGAVHDLKTKKGPPLLVQAAMDAVRQWRYRPFQLNGKPVQSQVDITVDFKLPTQVK